MISRKDLPIAGVPHLWIRNLLARRQFSAALRKSKKLRRFCQTFSAHSSGFLQAITRDQLGARFCSLLSTFFRKIVMNVKPARFLWVLRKQIQSRFVYHEAAARYQTQKDSICSKSASFSTVLRSDIENSFVKLVQRDISLERGGCVWVSVHADDSSRSLMLRDLKKFSIRSGFTGWLLPAKPSSRCRKTSLQ